MGTKKETVELVLTAVDKQSKVIDSISKKLNTYNSKAEQASTHTNTMRNAVGKLSIAVGGFITLQLAKKLANITLELGKLGATAELVNANFEKFAKKAGHSAESMMSDLTKASKGMIDNVTLQQNAMKSLISGVKYDDLIVAMEYVSSYAIATGANVAQKMETVMTGFARGSAQFLDDVGIQVMGAEDVVGAAVEQMREKMDNFANSSQSTAVKIAKVSSELTNAKVIIGQQLIPLANSFYGFIEKWIKPVTAVTVELLRMHRVMLTSYTLEDARYDKQVEAYKASKNALGLSKMLVVVDRDLKANQEEYVKAVALQANWKTRINYIGKKGVEDDKKRVEELKKENLELVTKANLLRAYMKEILYKPSTGSTITNTVVNKTTSDGSTEHPAKILSSDVIWEAYYKKLRQAVRVGKSAFNEMSEFLTADAQYKWELKQKEIEDLKNAEAEKIDTIKRTAATTSDVAKSLQSSIGNAVSQRYAREVTDLNRQKEHQRDAIKESRMSNAQKEKALASIAKDGAKKRYEIALKEWRMNLGMSIANTALGVTKNLASYAYPMSLIMAGLSTATGIIATASIAKNKPQMAHGGIVAGNSYSGDKVDTALNSGELVNSPSMTKRLYDIATGKSQPSTNNNGGNNFVFEAPQVIVNGEVTDSKLEQITGALTSASERIIETIYTAFEDGSIDYSRLTGLATTL